MADTQDSKARHDYLVYARQKLWSSVRILAVLPGDVRSRLKEAFTELAILRTDELPPEVTQEIKLITSEMTKYQPSSRWQDGPVEATMSRIRRATGVGIAIKIVDLYEKIDRLCEAEVPSPPRVGAAAHSVKGRWH